MYDEDYDYIKQMDYEYSLREQKYYEEYYNGLKYIYLNSYCKFNHDILHSHDNVFFISKLLSDNSTSVIYYEHDFVFNDPETDKLYIPNKISENLYYLTQIVMKIMDMAKNDTKI